jgi:tetratricopeptide (TPR) repeat protein
MMRVYQGGKQLSMARLVALRAMKIDEADPELYFTLAQILLDEKEVTKARLQFQKVLDVRPDFLPAHVELARLSMELEDYPAAEEHLRRILQANGKNAEAHLNLGVAYKSMGEYDKAMQEYDEAEKINSALPGLYLNRAVILHRYKDAPERAVELYKKYLLLAPEVAADPDNQVNALLKEAEQIVQAKAEGAKAEEEARKMAEQQKQDEKNNPAQGPPGTPGAGEPPKEGGPAAKDAAAPEPGAGATVPAKGAKPPPAAAPPPKADKPPEKPAKNPGEPGDEPKDGL